MAVWTIDEATRDPHAWLVAAGYLRRGATVEQAAVGSRLPIAEVRAIAERLQLADQKRAAGGG